MFSQMNKEYMKKNISLLPKVRLALVESKFLLLEELSGNLIQVYCKRVFKIFKTFSNKTFCNVCSSNLPYEKYYKYLQAAKHTFLRKGK